MNFRQEKLEEILVKPQETLDEVLQRMERAALQVLLVVDDKKRLLGIITDGDIRRTLLNDVNINLPVTRVMHSNPKAIYVNSFSIKEARQLMLENNIRHIPLVDEQQKVVDIVLWLDLFGSQRKVNREKVVIMAGGKGTRLDPFTKILPKPMIPLGDKPMVEVIMDKFFQQGFSDFVLSLGYKAEIVRTYFQENNSRPYEVNFVQEDEVLGTAGSLSLLKRELYDSFIVTNCDIIVEVEYARLLEYHREQKNVLTIVGALRDFTIPYGVLRTEGQELVTMDEKPSFHMLVNTGVYILEPEALNYIQYNGFLHMTELILRLREENMRVGVYPYHGQWFDVGQWEEYRQTLRQFDLLS